MQRLWILLFACLSFSLSAQQSLQQAARQLANDPALKNGLLGLHVIRVKDGSVLAAENESRKVAPASTQKLITTATALNTLGRAFRYETTLEYSGQIVDGALKGSLYIRGTGDPSLGSPFLEGGKNLEQLLDDFALAVQSAGISRIDGQIIGDATAFESNACGRTWQWEDMGNYYGAGVWGLNIHENMHFLHFQQRSGLGQRPGIASVEPEVPGLQFNNELETAPRGSGDNAYIFGAPYQYSRYIRGSIPAGSGTFTIKGSVPNPPLWLAQLLEQRLSAVGIIAAGSGSLISAPVSSGRKVIYTHQSPPLSAIVTRANMESVNLYCEAMLKTLVSGSGNKAGAEDALEQLMQHWKDKGLNTEGVKLQDGSGLSEANRISARFLAELLARMAASGGESFEAFYESIPLAGRSGSMKRRLKGTAAEGRLRAKSGTLENVRSLAGYARASNGDLLAYALIANDYSISGGQMRQKLERFLVILCR